MTTKATNWYGKPYTKKLYAHVERNLNRASIFLVKYIKQSFRDSGAQGSKSGATRQEREANRSKPGEPPHVQLGHLKENVGYEKGGFRLTRRIGTGIGTGKESVGYAVALELVKNRPFLRPALKNNEAEIRAMIRRPML